MKEVMVTDCLELLIKARQAELCVQAEIEHIERLHRIMRTSGKSRRYAEQIASKLAMLETDLNREIDTAVDIKRKALCIMSALDGYERTVIYRYYILGEGWNKIADKMYFSERQVYNYRKSAMKKLSEKYGSHKGEPKCLSENELSI